MRWTDEVRWSDLARSAIILGIVPDDSKRSMFAVRAILKARIKSGKVKRRKEGKAQSARAFYRGKK